MNEPPLALAAAEMTDSRANISRLLFFFGACLCRGGARPDRRADLPAAELLSERSAWLDAGASHRLSHCFQSAVDHQAALRHGFRFRAAVRLSAQELSDPRQYCGDRRIFLGHAASRADRHRLRVDAHGLRHGDIEHAVRRGAGGERPTAAARVGPSSISNGFGSTLPPWPPRLSAANWWSGFLPPPRCMSRAAIVACAPIAVIGRNRVSDP